MTTEQIETVIVGAGQAGLATAYHLQRLGRPCVVLEANERVGDGWRKQWDSLRLYSPAAFDALPGKPFPAPRWSYPGKDAVADYFETYAAELALPVRTGVRVDRVSPLDGGYLVTAGDDSLRADNVVIATGTFGRAPNVPSFADQLDPGILQLHSSEYRRPAQLHDGLTLVVGASHSGSDIAHEVALTHPTLLVGRDTGQMPIKLDSPSARIGFAVFLFAGRHIITRRTPIGRRAMDMVRHHGGPLLRVKRADLEARGVERVTNRVAGVQHGKPVLDDGRVVDAANVVWATGFRQTFDWLDLPVTGPDGWPEEMRGVVAKAPGLYFAGLAFQYAFSSMLVAGAGRDAAYVAKRIARRERDLERDAQRDRQSAPLASAG